MGGRIEAEISSTDLAAEARAQGAPVEALPDRRSLLDRLGRTVRENDTILVMGARDESLTQLCRDISASLEKWPGEETSGPSRPQVLHP